MRCWEPKVGSTLIAEQLTSGVGVSTMTGSTRTNVGVGVPLVKCRR